jgi:hypothetical protein
MVIVRLSNDNFQPVVLYSKGGTKAHSAFPVAHPAAQLFTLPFSLNPSELR